ncbi:MAG: methyltransferase domain-containing protein [Clostridia bacterium]|nr:methyltransferase domain-containing protein [Clostridia bacterium]
MNQIKVEKFYNLFANEYAKLFFNELDQKPFDRDFLKRFAGLIEPNGKVCDIGCGPGEVARYLKDQGIDVFGVDLSDEMIQEAKKLNPDISFQRGNMMALHLKDNELSGISAAYAIVNLTQSEIIAAIKEFNRVLNVNGFLLVSFHIGNNDVLPVEKGDGDDQVSIDYVFHDFDEILKLIKEVGFDIVEAIIRYPYENVEYPSKRGYIIAKKV